MVGEIKMTVVGNLTADPEVRFTQSGLAVANFTIASTPRTFDRQKNEFVDGEAVFLRCSVWRDYAENVAASLTKGMRVIATGTFKTRQYETKEGEKRTSVEMDIDEIGPSLRYAQAMVQRIQRDANMTRQQPPAEDAWAGHDPNATQQQEPQEPWSTPGGGADAWSQPGLDMNTPF